MLPLGLALVTAFVSAVVDAKTGRIPNWVTLPVMAVAVLWHGLTAGAAGLFLSLLGLLGSGLLPYLVFRFGGMGGGDVKLFAALGACLGLALGSEILMVSLVVGCLQAIVVLAWRRQIGRVARNAWSVLKNAVLPPGRRVEIAPARLTSLRLGPAIFASTVVVLLVL